MPEFKHEKYNASFSLPERVTVRQQLAYFSEAARAVNEELFVRLWYGARTIIQGWQCDILKLDADLDTITDPDASAVIVWASMRVKEYMDGLESVPKNS